MTTQPNQINVFLSYAHEDEIWLKRLETHLSLLKKQEIISTWHDRKIVPGTNWAKDIDTHLETASIILLLISADFIASDYCYGVEMQRALERQKAGEAQVIPLLVRPVDWKNAPFAHLPVLPTKAKPLTIWKDKDVALADVVMHLRRVIDGKPLPPSAPASIHPSVWTVPYRRNPHFTGRDEVLNRLSQQFTPTGQNAPASIGRVALTQPRAITGLGGIGKTQIAVEYAYRSLEQELYTHILWMNAANEETIVGSIVEIARALPAFSASNETDQQKLIEAIKRWLEQCEQRWLLIFDNVDNTDNISRIQAYFPQKGNGSILLTTRASAVGAIAASIEVEKMGLMEGVQFLLHRTQRADQTSDEEQNEAMNIVIALDSFPLALDQAGAYIEETKCGFVDYLQIYQDRRRELHARRGQQATNYPDSVATTWSLSFKKIEQANPAAAELLHLCAFLASDKIPEELITEGTAYWPPLLQQATTHLFPLHQMLEELLKFSLIQRLEETRMITIHRLVQAVQRDTMESKVQYQWAERAVRAVNKVFPRDAEDVAVWPQCLRYLDQVQTCNALIERYKLPLTEAADLLCHGGIYLYTQALYTIAEPLYQRALRIWEQSLGPEHPQVASPLNNLAILYSEQGKYAEAEPLYQRALHIREQSLGPEHPDVASSLNGLAELYREQGKYAEAEPLYQRALRIWEQSLGLEHPQVASPLNNLANLYKEQGKYAEAEPLSQRALRIWEQSLGPEHPDVAYPLNGLASLYREQGKYAEAEPLYQRALRIWEQSLGPEHPDVAYPLHGLANLYKEQGKYAEAEPLYQRALRIREQSLGLEHPDVAYPLNNLANLYYQQGKYAEAEPLYQRALRIWEQSLGPDHPHVAYPLHGLANLYKEQGKYAGAEPLYQRALRIRKQSLGPEHPFTQTVHANYTSLVQKMRPDTKRNGWKRVFDFFSR